ncbi:hypothetical protein Tco_1303449 [Tanacetum coccineum]
MVSLCDVRWLHGEGWLSAIGGDMSRWAERFYLGKMGCQIRELEAWGCVEWSVRQLTVVRTRNSPKRGDDDIDCGSIVGRLDRSGGNILDFTGKLRRKTFPAAATWWPAAGRR